MMIAAAVGPIKQRERGFGAGELLTGIAAGQRAGPPHVATWAEAETVLGDGTDDPRATAPDLLRRALASLPPRARQ